MNTLSDKAKPVAILGVLALVAIVTVAPHAFAQQGPSGVNPAMADEYNDSDNPYGPLQGMAWAAGLAIAGVMSGIGAWTAVRKH